MKICIVKDKLVDLRSDTLSKPCSRMKKIMLSSTMGDDSYYEDEITNDLEKFCASYFGMDFALFMPSGTMSNQVAIRCWTNPGDEIILDHIYHINYYEAGATVDLGKVYLNVCNTKDGIVREQDLLSALENKHRSSISNHAKLICLENTISALSGKIYPLEEIRLLSICAKQHNLKIHIDGARILNACVSSGIPPNEYARYVDSMTVCFSKGLGAPFGSILMGDKEFINKARKYRKWYGGGLHQSGFMASCALFAIQNNVLRLADDHKRARDLANSLKNIPLIQVNPADVETNIVMFDIKRTNMDSYTFVNMLKEKENILLYPWSRYQVRAVTYSGIENISIQRATNGIISFLHIIANHQNTGKSHV